MIKHFINNIKSIFRCTQGIKTIYKGNKKIYDRKGGYLYITIKD